ncbi:MAG TPA: radical SAM protein [Phycisphaerales bacterium]|nr:radical SAM protein [Phycisphaerales bacterium]
MSTLTMPVIRDAALEPIAAKVEAGERLSLAEGELLFTTPDLWTVLGLADQVRRRLHGDAAYYNVNRHLNYSNICALSCKFCEFYRKRGEEGAYEHSIEDVRAEARRAIEAGATEMHIVGGLHPYLPFEYYTDMLAAIREESEAAKQRDSETGAASGTLHIKAFTAVEIVHLAKIAKVYKASDRRSGIRWVLERLKDAGLGSLPGGGAEVFDDRVHDEAFKGKIRSDVWLDVHRIAHELGLNTNATILYGHVEQRRERLIHMDMLRRTQDVALARLGYEARQRNSETAKQGTDDEWPGEVTLTRPGTPLPRPGLPDGVPPVSLSRCLADSLCCGYFQTIIPLPFFPDGSELEHLPGPSGLENLRMLAVSRLMLDNFPHVKAFWIMQTLGMAQLMLQNGADDIDGTVVWYDITKVGGADTHQETTVWDLQRAIREAGFRPVERDTLYRRVERDGKRWWIAEG